MPSAKNAAKYEEEETHFYATGAFAATTSETVRTRHLNSDYRRSEALALASRDPLQTLKAVLYRGKSEEAHRLLTLLKGMKASPEFKTEIALQEARYTYLNGDWAKTTSICNSIENELSPSALSLMTLYQIRSNSLYELSDFAKSWADYRRVESFESLFPYGQLPLYAHTNRLRLLAYTGAIDEARPQERALWEKWRSGLPDGNLDTLQTLLRARIELLRAEKSPYGPESLAAYAIAKANGDALYAALAYFDAYCCYRGTPEGVNYLRKLRILADEHPRLKKLMSECFPGEDTIPHDSQSARTIRGAVGAPNFAQSSTGTPAPDEIDKVILLGLGVIVHLKQRTIAPLVLATQSQALLRALVKGPIDKADLFREVWKLRNFSVEKHDQAIRIAIHRLRSSVGVTIESKCRNVSIAADTLLLEV